MFTLRNNAHRQMMGCQIDTAKLTLKCSVVVVITDILHCDQSCVVINLLTDKIFLFLQSISNCLHRNEDRKLRFLQMVPPRQSSLYIGIQKNNYQLYILLSVSLMKADTQLLKQVGEVPHCSLFVTKTVNRKQMSQPSLFTRHYFVSGLRPLTRDSLCLTKNSTRMRKCK